MSTINNPSGGTVPGKGSDPNRPIPDPRPPEKNGGPHYTPWLIVRAQAGDTGGRPLAPGTVFWESPDVWTLGSLGINQPVAGEPTQVFARVTNLGLADANGVTIQYWWANPSIAITPASVHPIGLLTGITIPAQNSMVFQSPTDWTPIQVNNGHECLIVQAFIPVIDPLTDPMHPTGDRHVGQKNEQLVMLAQSQRFEFKLEARNFTAQEQQVAVEVRQGLIPRNFAGRFGGARHLPARLLDPAISIPVEIAIGAQPAGTTATTTEGTAYKAPDAAAVAPGIDCRGPAQARQTQLFRPAEVRPVVIAGALPPNASPGEVYVIRISQSVGQVLAGGYTLYLTLSPGTPR